MGLRLPRRGFQSGKTYGASLLDVRVYPNKSKGSLLRLFRSSESERFRVGTYRIGEWAKCPKWASPFVLLGYLLVLKFLVPFPNFFGIGRYFQRREHASQEASLVRAACPKKAKANQAEARRKQEETKAKTEKRADLQTTRKQANRCT